MANVVLVTASTGCARPAGNTWSLVGILRFDVFHRHVAIDFRLHLAWSKSKTVVAGTTCFDATYRVHLVLLPCADCWDLHKGDLPAIKVETTIDANHRREATEYSASAGSFGND